MSCIKLRAEEISRSPRRGQKLTNGDPVSNSPVLKIPKVSPDWVGEFDFPDLYLLKNRDGGKRLANRSHTEACVQRIRPIRRSIAVAIGASEYYSSVLS